MWRVFWVLTILVTGAAANTVTHTAAQAEPQAETAEYDLKIRGLKVGHLTLRSQSTPDSYALAGVIRNTGLTRVIRRFSYRGQAKGKIYDGRLTPAQYMETANTGKRASEAEIHYDAQGVPRVITYASPDEPGRDAPPPQTQGGTVDPLTAVYDLLRDVPLDRACQTDVMIFDGKRQSRITSAHAGTQDGLPVCSGRYERLLGFTPDEVARHRKFDFTLTYRRVGDHLQVDRVSFGSIYGKAVIDRR